MTINNDYHCQHAENNLTAIPEESTVQAIASFYKVFGDMTRMKILFSLRLAPLCVHDISKLLGIEQSAISHQLKILRDHGAVKRERIGKNNHYSLDDIHVEQILDLGLEHIEHKNKR